MGPMPYFVVFFVLLFNGNPCCPPQLSACALDFTPVSQKVASLHLLVGGQFLTVVWAYSPLF